MVIVTDYKDIYYNPTHPASFAAGAQRKRPCSNGCPPNGSTLSTRVQEEEDTPLDAHAPLTMGGSGRQI